MKNLKSGLDLHKIDNIIVEFASRRWLMLIGGGNATKILIHKRFSIRAFDGVYVSYVCIMSKI